MSENRKSSTSLHGDLWFRLLGHSQVPRGLARQQAHLWPMYQRKSKKAISLLYRFRTSVGQLWGPIPFLTRWVLTGIVHPMVMYSTIVWANKATNYKKRLDRVQRLGLLAMAHICHSTPSSWTGGYPGCDATWPVHTVCSSSGSTEGFGQEPE